MLLSNGFNIKIVTKYLPRKALLNLSYLIKSCYFSILTWLSAKYQTTTFVTGFIQILFIKFINKDDDNVLTDHKNTFEKNILKYNLLKTHI